jgi:hypothetical protein
MKILPEFPDFLGKAVVHGQNLHSCIWEFGKGALSASEALWNGGMLEYWVSETEKVVLLVQEHFA